MIDQLKIRELLRKTENKFISEKKVAQILNVDKQSASDIMIHLEKAGFIEKAGVKELWQNSLRGKILANKKLKKEFREDTLKIQLGNFVKRMKIVNSSKEYPENVSCAIVTSEYPIKCKSGGINIAYSLSSKRFSEEERDNAEHELRKRHKGSFGNIVEYVYYPHTAIRIFLKARSPVLKLKEYTQEEIKNITGFKIVE